MGACFWYVLPRIFSPVIQAFSHPCCSTQQMLALAGALYYTTYSNSKVNLTASTTGGVGSNRYSHASHLDVAHDPAVHLWNILNPSGDKFLHVKIEPPAFVTFSPDGGESVRSRLPEREHRPSLAQCVIGPLLQLWKIIIVPTFVTNFLLWLVLRYLMRDAELIEAQRHREDGDDAPLLEGGGRVAERTPPLNNSGSGIVSYKQLERACAYDIMLVASNSDASVVAALSTQHELAVWFDYDGRHASINCASLLRPATTGATNGVNVTNAKHRATHLALDSQGAWCALATGSGLLVIWSLTKGSVILQCRALVAPGSSPGIPIRDITFVPPGSGAGTSRSTSASSVGSNQHSKLTGRDKSTLVITDDHGNAYTWPFLTSPVPTIMATKNRETPDSRRSSMSSSGEFSPRHSTAATSIVPHPDGASAGTGRHLHARSVFIRGQKTHIVASVSSTNVFSLKDTRSDEKICFIEDPMLQSHDASIDRARIGALVARPCRTCSGTKPATIVFAASSKGVVHVYHIPSPDGVSCSCAQQDLLERSARPRRPSQTTPVITPLKMRRKTSSISSIGSDSPTAPTSKDYPMYGHGVHSRREKTRDSTDDQTFLVPPPHVLNGEMQPAEVSQPLHRVIKVAVIACDRGGWDICGGGVIGVRKRARGSSLPPRSVDAYVAALRGEIPQQTASRSLTPFENWEVWMSDSTGTLRVSCIADLPHTPKRLIPIDEDGRNNGLFFHPPLLPSTFSNITSASAASESVPRVRVYPRIPFTRASCFTISPSDEYCLVGFGNTALVIRVPRDVDHSVNPPRQPTSLWMSTAFSFLSGSNSL